MHLIFYCLFSHIYGKNLVLHKLLIKMPMKYREYPQTSRVQSFLKTENIFHFERFQSTATTNTVCRCTNISAHACSCVVAQKQRAIRYEHHLHQTLFFLSVQEKVKLLWFYLNFCGNLHISALEVIRLADEKRK